MYRALEKIGCFLTWIKEQDELQADVVGAVELEGRQLGRQLLERVRHGWDAEECERQELELLSVVKRCLVRQVVVHPLVDLVQDQHLRPRVLQQRHLVVNLKI